MTDGAFAETKEALGGFYLIEAADLDEAIAIAKTCPAALGGRRGAAGDGRSTEAAADVAADAEVAAAVADAHRREWAFVLAATVRVTRDLDLAEECVQDAYARALVAVDRGRHPGPAGRVADHRRPAAGAGPAAPRRAPLARALPLLVEDDLVPGPDERRRRAGAGPRRPAAAGLHLLPPRARAGGPGGADPAAGVRAHHGRGGARLPGQRADDGGPDHPGQEEDRRGPHPLPGAARPRSCPRASTRC